MASLLVLLALACTAPPLTDTAAQVVVAGPTLVHEPPTTLWVQGQAVSLSATAEDPDGVRTVAGFYRTVGDAVWQNLPLVPDGEGRFTAAIDGARVRAPGVEYYFKGVDASTAQAVTYLPRQGFDTPFRVDVQRIGAPLPFAEDFEGTGSSLYSLGWVGYSRAFAAFGWQWTTARAHQGAHGATHPRGTVDAAVLDDWLVSPAVDLAGVERLEVSWWELGDYADQARHSLWISTGSPDPADGEYELVQDVAAAPEDSWARAQVVDISAWTGARAAYVAWRYQGQFADAWTIDDVRIRELHPDIQLRSLSWGAAAPGEPTTLTVELENRTDAPVEELLLSGQVDATRGSFDAPRSLGALDGRGAVAADLVLHVDPSHPDNARLPFTVVATAADATWTWDRELVVGQASSAVVNLNVSGPTVLSAALVVGDPTAPSLTVPVTAGSLSAGPHRFEVDLTDHGGSLPPEPGPRRWWLRVDAQGAGAVTSWGLNYDGVDYTSQETGGFSSNTTAWFALPRPPRPALQELVTTPALVAPGDAVDVALTLVNNGAATFGATTLSVRSLDPGVTVVDGGPMSLGTAGWGTGAPVTVHVPVQVDVSKVDSRPAQLALVIADEVESTELSASLRVPWPVLQVTGVMVLADDNGDGVLDPGEAANLRVQLTNRGLLDTASSLTCTLADAGGTATASVLAATASYGKLLAGETDRDSGFRVRATAGAPGDIVALGLHCVENAGARQLDTELLLELGERPWTTLAPLGDPVGDALAGYGFDFDSGSFRSDGATLQVRLHSAVAFDPDALFLEAWGQSLGARYDTFQLVAQSGVASLRGYDGVFGTATRLAPPVLTVLDAQTIELAIDLTSMGLLLNSLEIGFAAGFCGADGYYCDQFPDAWGDPYQTGLNADAWVELRW